MLMLESPGVLFSWEVIRSLLLVFITGGVTWAVKILLGLRDSFHDLTIEVRGVDGKNGLKSKVKVLEGKVNAIDERHTRLDAVEEYERQQYHGEDRRKETRRLRDIVRDADGADSSGNPSGDAT